MSSPSFGSQTPDTSLLPDDPAAFLRQCYQMEHQYLKARIAAIEKLLGMQRVECPGCGSRVNPIELKKRSAPHA